MQMIDTIHNSNAVVGQIQRLQLGKRLQMFYPFNHVIVQEETVQLDERMQIVNVQETIVLQVQGLVELKRLEGLLLVAKTNPQIGRSHQHSLGLVF
jgi:hypothetical protein